MLVQRLEQLQARANQEPEYEDYISAIEDWEVELNLLTQGDKTTENAPLPYEAPVGAQLMGGEDVIRDDGSIYMGGVNGGLGLGMFNSLRYSNDVSADS